MKDGILWEEPQNTGWSRGKSVRKEWERLSITDPCCPAPPKGVR